MSTRYPIYMSASDLFELRRSALVRGGASLNKFLIDLARQYAVEDADLLTQVERTILAAVDAGLWEAEQIAGVLGEKHAKEVHAWLRSLVKRGHLEEVQKGGGTQKARGAKTKYYRRPDDVGGDRYVAPPAHSYAARDE